MNECMGFPLQDSAQDLRSDFGNETDNRVSLIYVRAFPTTRIQIQSERMSCIDTEMVCNNMVGGLLICKNVGLQQRRRSVRDSLTRARRRIIEQSLGLA